jgi:hypothetical protein
MMYDHYSQPALNPSPVDPIQQQQLQLQLQQQQQIQQQLPQQQLSQQQIEQQKHKVKVEVNMCKIWTLIRYRVDA